MLRTKRSRPGFAGPAQLLFGAYRHRVLSLLLRHPEEMFHVREIARRTSVPAGSLHRELRLLGDAGILHRMPAGNQVRYGANRASPGYRGLVSILNETAAPKPASRDAAATRAARRARGQPYVSQAELANICRRYGVRRMSLFGSAARGEQRPQSDVDLLVEFDPKSHTSSFDLVHMQAQLSGLFGNRNVEIASTSILRNPFRRRTIERDLKVLYAA